MDAQSEQPNGTAPTFRLANLPSTVAVTGTEGVTLRDIYTEDILKRFPNFKPRSDVDTWLLGAGSLYRGPEDGIYAWIDNEIATYVTNLGSEREVERVAKEILSPTVEVTGRKPKQGEESPCIFGCPIPNCDYAMRFFPGAFVRQEYCLDFVKAATGAPVNSPFDFELWAVPGPPLHMLFPMRLMSLEESFGVRPENVPPGTETFVLRDGMTCLLKRPGNRTVRFTVPVRVKEAAAA